jgi:cell division protein FtsN
VVAEDASPAAERKPRSIMDLFRATRGEDAAAPGPGTRVTEPETQVAAVEPPPPAAAPRRAAEAQPVTGSGFVVQLSSFRSAAEARQEYGRLSSLYPSVVGGLSEQIRETSVGGSTRYQLGLGPLASRSDATRVCSALITAGESDCIVRGR